MQTPHHLARMSTPARPQKFRITRQGTSPGLPWLMSCPFCPGEGDASSWRIALRFALDHVRTHAHVSEVCS